MSSLSIFHLEMLSPGQLRPKPEVPGLEVKEAELKQFRFNRYLYQLVGEQWQWTDMLSWSDAQWQEHAESDTLRTWVAYYRGSIAGYYELQRQTHNTVELLYFGLAPGFIGQGFGGYLLSHAISSAWAWGDVDRVWVHTCSLDHPSALRNYQARGFELFQTETQNPPDDTPAGDRQL